MLTLNALVHAPTPFLYSHPHHRFSSSSAIDTTCRSSPMAASARIAVVGDVHDDWDIVEDTKALQVLQVPCFSPINYFLFLLILPNLTFFESNNLIVLVAVEMQPDLVLFTGDFGNENVELVQNVASLKFPKAVILGNHDSWKTQNFSKKKKDGVQLQLESLGEDHVAFKRLDFPSLKISVVGGRPFSCGGEQFFRRNLLSARYGVQNMDESATKIYSAALGSPEEHFNIFLAHNGPTGLGSNLNDICGKDWVAGGSGDHGDPDLEQAISRLKETTDIVIPLVVFGHMHKDLAHGNGHRKMIVVGADKTIYLNAAIVPRVQRFNSEQGVPTIKGTFNMPKPRGTMRGFTLIEILEGRVGKITETWVSVVGDDATLQEEQILFDCDNSFVNR